MTVSVFSFTANADNSFKPVLSGGSGSVNSISQRSDGKVVVSGSFIVASGKRNNRIALLNPDGTADTTFNTGKGVVNSSGFSASIAVNAVQSDNKILIAGNFDRVNGFVRNQIARLNADGTVDTSFDVGNGFNGQIFAVKILPTGKILVGGSFSTFNSQAAGRVVRLNSDGTLDSSFSTLVTSGTVRGLVTQSDGKIIIHGTTFNINGTQRRGVARLNEDGTLDSTFDPANGTTSSVFSAAVQSDGKILIGGMFTTFNGANQRGIARLNSNGMLDTSFMANVNVGTVTPVVYALGVQSDGKIILGGNFENINSINRNRIARVNSDGSLDTAFAADVPNNNSPSVTGISILSNQTIVIGGTFSSVNGTFRVGIAALNADGMLASAFAQGVGDVGRIEKMEVQADGKIVIAGGFSHVNGILSRGVARLNTDGSLDPTFNTGSGVVGYVGALAIQSDGKIIIGGNIDSYNGIGRGNITRINPDGSLDTSFPQGVSGINFHVLDIAIQSDNKIIAVGEFFRDVIRFNPNGTQDTGFNVGTGLSGTGFSVIIQPDGKVIIAGGFTAYNGTARNGIVRVNPDGSIDNSFNPPSGANLSVYDVALQSDGKIVAVGDFTTFNGVNVNRVIRLNSDGTTDSSFNSGTGADDRVNTVLVQPDGKLILGGNFNSYNNTNRDRLARLLPTGSLDPGFAANLDFFYEDQLNIGPRVHSLIIEKGNLLVGGLFSEINEEKWSSIARFSNVINSTNRTRFDFDGDLKTDISIFRPSVGEWWYLRSSDNQVPAVQFGQSTDKIVPADYTGDGKTDIAFFRESTGEWFVIRSEDFSFYAFPFGSPGDKAVPADFDGDGKADPTVFRPSNAVWYSLQSSDGGVTFQQFGVTEDVPLPNDFDGDGKADIGVFRPTPSEWWILKSTGGVSAFQFGATGDKPAPADFTGDGKTDVAFWRPADGFWYVLRSEDNSFYAFPFGSNGDTPVAGDYDGDGRADAAVFRPSNTTWYIQQTTAGFTAVQFGASGDKPVPSAYLP